MGEMMRCLAPAKINLSLRILGRREDGFHDLESLMVPVSVFDVLEILPTDGGGLSFSCSDASLPTGEENLVVRAVNHFCSSVGIVPNLQVFLEKHIPHGAGLGGGSSDAASVFLALNTLFGTELPRETLAAMGAELGSDIPFFIYQSAAWIRGRGERVEPISGLCSVPLLLVKPGFGVPTPWAYKRWKDSVEIPGVPYAEQRLACGALVNDLERPVFEKYLFLADLKAWLLEQPEVDGALMSGSGSTVFAVLREKAQGYGLGERLAAEFGDQMWAYLCETIP
ncbi:MAG: 4-(cytidine 5-diphospho)-2-C-methyl-D-erythritol kinase [Verrucomicrobiota bacterium]